MVVRNWDCVEICGGTIVAATKVVRVAETFSHSLLTSCWGRDLATQWHRQAMVVVVTCARLPRIVVQDALEL